jgi:uncharacterized protein (TIGR02246 family)
MATTVAADTILDLEREYWDAVKRKDADTVARLSAESCLVVGSQGIREIERDEIARMATQHELDGYSVTDRSARVLPFGDDVAVVAYEVESTMTRDGKRSNTRAYDSSVWVRDGGEWRCLMHTETPTSK